MHFLKRSTWQVLLSHDDEEDDEEDSDDRCDPIYGVLIVSSTA